MFNILVQVLSQLLMYMLQIPGVEIPGVQSQRPRAVSFEEVASAFKYTFDRFQQQAVEKFLAGHSVVVCAPTASGKTAIAEAAAIAVLARCGAVCARELASNAH